jgi:hypothetical protein
MLVVILGLVLPLTACGKHGQDKRDIALGWESYRAAAESGDGATASAALSKSAHEFYGRLIKLAPDAPAAECWKLRPIEMLELAGMRTSYTRKDLKSMSGAAYVTRTIKDHHWGTYDSEWKLRDIRVNDAGDSATAVICNPQAESDYRTKKIVGNLTRSTRRMSRGMIPDAPPTFPAAFVKEGDSWKYDETATLAGQNQELIDGAREEGVSVRDYVTMLATDEYDMKKALKIWDPMNK